MGKRTIVAVMTLVALACSRHETPATATHGYGKGKDAAPVTTQTVAQAAPPETPATTKDAAIGSVMPAYSAKLLDGSKFDLASEHGNVVFLNLWATWCGPCRGEIPELQKMHDQYASQGFKVIGVSLDDTGADGVRDFVKENKMTYPIVLDPEGNAASLFQTNVLPTSAVIDRSGHILWKKFGGVSMADKEMQAAIAKALAAKG